MASNNIYHVIYHFEVNNKRVTETAQANILAASQDQTTIFNVLNSNGKVPAAYTQANFVIECVGHASVAASGALN